MELTLYGDQLTLYGEVLVLYPDEPTEERLGGAWLPVIYLDRDGNPVDLNAKIEEAVEAAETELEPEQRAAVETVSGRLDDARWIIANDAAREAEIVLQYLERIDAYIADLIRQDIERAAQDAEDEAAAILLLMH